MPAEFGLSMAVFVVVASMVGTGVLTTSGFTMALVESNFWMLVLWLVGGVIAICGALTLAELSAALPRTGGDYVYLYESFGPLAAFLSGWVSFLIGFSAPSAAAAFGSAKYLLTPLHLGAEIANFWQRVLATLAIIGFAFLHVSGRRITARFQVWMTALKVSVLVVLALTGFVAGGSNIQNLADPRPIDWKMAQTMLFSLVFIYYAYTGWNGASYLAGEIRNPQRELPKAIFLGTGLVVLLYLAVNAMYALALTPADLAAIIEDPANKEGLNVVAPIAEIASQKLFGRRWSDPLSVTIGLMLFSTLSVYVLIGPRVLYAMARAGQFPAAAGRLTPRTGTPAMATLIQVIASLILLWSGSFESLFVYAGVGLSLFSMLSMSSIYVLRRTQPDLPRPFRTPGYPITPAIYLGLTGMLTVAAFSQRPKVSTYALLSILAGIPVYGIWNLARRRFAASEESC
jgi:APA family basic amino acid/polyamine antiporter